MFDKYEVINTQPFINWAPGKWWATNREQPNGKKISFSYSSKLLALSGITVKVAYEIYDGLPVICKWVTIENKTSATIMVDRVVNEIIAMVEEERAVVESPEQMKTPQSIYIETNYAFNNAMRYSISDQTTHWKTDSSYTSQVNYNYQTPCLLEVYPDKAKGIKITVIITIIALCCCCIFCGFK